METLGVRIQKHLWQSNITEFNNKNVAYVYMPVSY